MEKAFDLGFMPQIHPPKKSGRKETPTSKKKYCCVVEYEIVNPDRIRHLILCSQITNPDGNNYLVLCSCCMGTRPFSGLCLPPRQFVNLNCSYGPLLGSRKQHLTVLDRTCHQQNLCR